MSQTAAVGLQLQDNPYAGHVAAALVPEMIEPVFGAKREYEAIAKCAGGSFTCVGEQPTESNPEPLELTVSAEGLSLPAKQETGRKSAAIITSASTPMPHGSR